MTATHNPNAQRGPWCTVCEAEKRADNHWFETEEVTGWSLSGDSAFPQLVIRRLRLPLQPNCNPVCGEKCLQKRVSVWAGAHLLPHRAVPETPTLNPETRGAR